MIIKPIAVWLYLFIEPILVFSYNICRQGMYRGHSKDTKSTQITIQTIQLLKNHYLMELNPYWSYAKANRNTLANTIVRWLMNMVTMSWKLNYYDKVRKLSQQEYMCSAHLSIWNQIIGNFYSFSCFFSFSSMFGWYRNKSSIKHNCCIGLIRYHHFNYGGFHSILSTNEETLKTGWCHTCCKYFYILIIPPPPPSFLLNI